MRTAPFTQMNQYYRQLYLTGAPALMKTCALLAGLIASRMPCFAQDHPVTEEKRTWGASYMRTVEGDNKDRRLEFNDITQDPEHLVGSCVLARQNKGSPQLVIQGHLNKSGEFTPNVSLAVSDRADRDWKVIESTLADKVDVTLTGAPHINILFVRIQFDAFQPYIGKFKFCQVVLQTGESDVFPMAWLTEKGSE
jgi:hypothetical protein